MHSSELHKQQNILTSIASLFRILTEHKAQKNPLLQLDMSLRGCQVFSRLNDLVRYIFLSYSPYVFVMKQMNSYSSLLIIIKQKKQN